MPIFQKEDVKIRYEEAGSGFPLLLVPGGGLNSRVSNWPNAVFNSMEIFKDEFRCITMDQRNANGGGSSGPIPDADPWDAFADDQLGLMDHLGIKRFLFLGYCIGGCFALKLMERAPERVMAGVLSVDAAVAFLLFVLIRRRSGSVLALAAAAIMLGLGNGWEEILWGF